MNALKPLTRSKLLCALLSLSIVAPQGLLAAPPVTLATSPLLTQTTSDVKPNILFTLDDSGSMDSTFVPDWAGDNDYDPHPYLQKTAEFNAQTYNPGTNYKAPIKSFDPTSGNAIHFPSQTGMSLAAGANTSSGAGLPNWESVKTNGFNDLSGTNNIRGGDTPFYYTLTPGEFCNSAKLDSCQAAQGGTYTHAATLRWCTTSTLGNATGTGCRALYNSAANSYKRARYSGMGIYKATISITAGTPGDRTITSIKIDGKEILFDKFTSTSNSGLASGIHGMIDTCFTKATGKCQMTGTTASVSGSDIVIYSPHGGLKTAPEVSGTGATFGATAFTYSTTGNPENRRRGDPDYVGFPNDINYDVYETAGQRIRVAIVPSVTSYPYPGSTAKHGNRTDCAGTTCTYAEEMTNYANWYAYYRTRMHSMKSAVGFAFQGLDNKFRVGFNVIGYQGIDGTGTRFLDVADFTIDHKNAWYSRLSGATCVPPAGANSCFTPLRASLAKMGQYFANKVPGQTDPVQYSCQQNFGILSTDGYWNSNHEEPNYPDYGPDVVDSNTNVGDQDNDNSQNSKDMGYWQGSTAATDSLADVAMYYYMTDLRTPGLSNCQGALGGAPAKPVCDNNVFQGETDTAKHQHMTSFTMGLGIDGNLQYIDDYASFDPALPLTLQSGDFERMVRTGSPMWGNPISDGNEARIDDLWHAAVNGRGSYFSAKSPDAVVAGFRKVLDDIGSKTASGAGAAASSQYPTAGSDKAFRVSYISNKWTGNLAAYTLLASGAMSATPSWCVEDVAAEECSPPDRLGTNGSGQTTCTRIGTPPFTVCRAGETLVGGNCVRIIAPACTGSLKGRITAPSIDDRKIFAASGGSLVDFLYANLPSGTNGVQKYFEEAYLTDIGTNPKQGLTQFSDGTLTATQKTDASKEFVNYLRGHTAWDTRKENDTSADTGGSNKRVFRERTKTLGDITEFKPNFVGPPSMNYSDTIDPGYSTFKGDNTGRAPVVYVGANDGMLHAFEAKGTDTTGLRELWAFVPTAVMPKMWALGDTKYATKHENLVNGKSFHGDVNSGGWKTILVAGLGGGGKGYFALNVTDPTDPKLLWEISETTAGFDNMGHAYGQPTVTKVNGRWVALLPSGYNNKDGQGHLYIVDAGDGTKIADIVAGGSDGSPSGLSEVGAWVDDQLVNNEALVAYGGDLDGKLWRFDVKAGSATLLADFGSGKPITTRPEMGYIGDLKVVFVGTGKYLETGDLTTNGTQSFYAVADKPKPVGVLPSGGIIGPSDLVYQELKNEAGNETRKSDNEEVKWTDPAVFGWRLDFPDTGERVHVNPRLIAGMLFVITIVPEADDCSPGGYSWFNYLDAETGGHILGTSFTGTKLDTVSNDPLITVQDGELHVGPCLSDGTCPEEPPPPDRDIIRKGGGPGTFQSARIMWRELIQ